MLSNTLNTNEIKNAAGAEIEFQRLEQVARSTVFAKITETPSLPHRLTISHQESGTGLKKRRRSVVRFDTAVVSDVDTTQTVTSSCYCVLDTPVGAVTTMASAQLVLANLMSFIATTGAATTVLFDCTGNGAKALVEGSL